jgi:hypothetical protein
MDTRHDPRGSYVGSQYGNHPEQQQRQSPLQDLGHRVISEQIFDPPGHGCMFSRNQEESCQSVLLTSSDTPTITHRTSNTISNIVTGFGEFQLRSQPKAVHPNYPQQKSLPGPDALTVVNAG